MAGDGEEEPPATGGGGGDKLVLRGLQFHGFHGVKQEEKKLGQKFVVDIDTWTDLAAAGDTDDISHTVSYTDIYRIAKGVVEGPSRNLLESVAQSIAALSFPPPLARSHHSARSPHHRCRPTLAGLQGTIDLPAIPLSKSGKIKMYN
ncbi:dihydroneopterin aldolase 2-like [Hordeum vulgare subsp. vulgare]|uniref:dihydroneopterin aldolase 2-like n=1 Tax=Hordeum vulgare subsp. vulgare TaxID=112509 RepID=UPI001D1A4673|nr:dihydroneopterin aldolase 2-like [Hordeum vulgare subsp. vulgare]